MAAYPPRTRFHQLIEQVVEEYERLQASAVEIHGFGPEDCDGPDSSGCGAAEEEYAAQNTGTAIGTGISFAEQHDQPGAFAREEFECLPVLDDDTVEDVDCSPAAMKWWELMVSLVNWEGMFVLRKCWTDEERGSMSASNSVRDHSQCSSIGRTSIFKTMNISNRMQLSSSDSSIMETDVVRLTWLEQRRASHRPSTASSARSLEWVRDSLGRKSAIFSVVQPHSMKRFAWVVLGMLLLLLDVLVLSMSAFGAERLIELDMIGAVYWTLDILATFRTAVYTKGGLDSNPRTIAKQYVAKWFWIDSFIVAFEWLMIALNSAVVSSSTAGLRYVKIVRHLRLVRVVKIDQMVHEALRRVQSLWALLAVRMTMYLFGVLMWVHMSAAAWYWVGNLTSDGWANKMEEPDMVYVHYLISLHWAASQLQGNVDVYPTLPVERAFASCHLLASIVVLALLIGKLTTVMQEMQEVLSAERRLGNAAQMYIKEHNISLQLAFNVGNYIARKQAIDARHSFTQNELELFQVLPAALRRALLQEARSPILLQHVLFSAIRRSNHHFFERLCCDLLRSVTMSPDERIFSVAVVCLHMYFVVVGEATYFAYTPVVAALMTDGLGMAWRDYQKQQRRNIVPEGACLCEPAIWVPWVHRGDFDATSGVSLLSLEVDAFAELVSSYFTVKLCLLEHAARWVRVLNEIESLTDLLTSQDALELEIYA